MITPWGQIMYNINVNMNANKLRENCNNHAICHCMCHNDYKTKAIARHCIPCCTQCQFCGKRVVYQGKQNGTN